MPATVILISLTMLAALLVTALATSAQGSVPDAPERPTGNAVFIGGVDLEWNDVPGADSYDVQLFRNGQWMDLPGDGVEIAFYGAGAIISELDPSSTYFFHVRARNVHGSSDWSGFNSMASTEQSTLGKRARPDNVAASGAPVINGTAQVRETLTVDTTDIVDENGLDRVKFRFQWISHDGSTDTDIAGATDSTYILVANDESKTIKVRVAFTDRGGYTETQTSAVTASVAARPNSVATGAPTITGTAQVGETLTADTSGIADTDGLSNVSYNYQWVRNDGTSDTDIASATNSTYTLAAADKGNAIKVRVSFTDDADNEESLTSAATASVAARLNSVATGAPTITGTAQVGQTLTADTSGIADADGMTNATFSYQWNANDGIADTDIAGATGSTYTLAATDEGNAIKVRVSFTDDADNDETLTSAATASVAARPNSVATGAPTITGTAQVGETLTADASRIADTDGLSNVSYSYQWVRNDGTSDTDIASATNSTYTLVAADEGKMIKVKVDFTDDQGNDESLTSTATATVSFAVQRQIVNSPATGKPAITGTVAVGETLTAITSGIMDSDGLSNAAYAYQWIRTSGGVDADIADSTGPTYTLISDDQGHTIKVRVTFTDDDGHAEILTSDATDLLLVTSQQESGQPTIRGKKKVGETLRARTSGIVDSEGVTHSGYTYQWIRTSGGVDVDIAMPRPLQYNTSPKYRLTLDDEGHTIKVRVNFWNYAQTLTSVATAEVTRDSNVLPGGSPVIMGTAEVGNRLTVDLSSITDGNGLDHHEHFRFQWIRTSAATDTNIPGATTCGYRVSSSDLGHTLKVLVRFTDDHYYPESLTSAATAVVAQGDQPPAIVSEAGGENLPANTCTTGEAAPGETVTGALRRQTDVDWFAIDLTRGNYYRLELKGASSNNGTLEDPAILGIAKQDGSYIGVHRANIGGQGRDVRTTWKPPSTRTYYLAVGSFRGSPGTYSLTVTQIGSGTDTIPSNRTTTAEVEVGGILLYVIQKPNDRDWIKVDLEAGKLYRIKLENRYTSGQVENQYPALFRVVDPNQVAIPDTTVLYEFGVSAHDQLRQHNVVLDLRAETDGYHYVKAGTTVRTRGLFAITVKEIRDDE